MVAQRYLRHLLFSQRRAHCGPAAARSAPLRIGAQRRSPAGGPASGAHGSLPQQTGDDGGPAAQRNTIFFFFFFSTCTSCHLLQRPRPPSRGGSPQLPAGPLPPQSSVDMPTASLGEKGGRPLRPAQVNMLTAAAQARAGSAPRVTHMSSAAGGAPTARRANPLTSHKSHLHRPPARCDRKLRSPSPPGLPSWRRQLAAPR